ncbi:hypothetical protein LTR91_004899 [Friedmanniomyces endolithicus]|uniref:RNase III domain-containing protein n=1 Tax=Friedmanniomyces endolithicus TaxID=329885 RepID=A0AAN6QYG0_9PEZI|nr:hypothetical protein LTR35_012161 [Friedmanniomyces endolithicus]KAK0284413.1 hypothetical protein LTS00_011370 [Friedmanniomyces endolithicus]KAK0323077.1 hypothetical protein LTR82_006008 [Friedmanniomyces endolithicus]KAK0922225.1 hypothetical protein LTR57_007913 [Friedmanniomyces endolithicus]KAK0996035.1 hypothetical protein LTR54_010329 [Friedmanniomyces endolithicus]
MSAQPRFAAVKTYIGNLLAYNFRTVTNLEEALWAYPATLSNGSYLPDGNKSLAVVGDAVLNLVVKHHCYVLEMKRGPASDLLQQVTCNAYLGAMSSGHEIATFVIMNPGSKAMTRDMRATAVEAIIGAVYRDCGGDHDTLVNVVTALGVL